MSELTPAEQVTQWFETNDLSVRRGAEVVRAKMQELGLTSSRVVDHNFMARIRKGNFRIERGRSYEKDPRWIALAHVVSPRNPEAFLAGLQRLALDDSATQLQADSTLTLGAREPEEIAATVVALLREARKNGLEMTLHIRVRLRGG